MRITSRGHALIAGAALVAVAGCRRGQDTTGGGAGAPHGGVPGAPPSMHLVADVSRGEWRMAAGDYGNLRYSTLDTITTTNAIP